MVPGGLSRIAAVAANTFRETVRERVLYNLVFFALLMTLSGLLVGELSVRQDERIVKDVGLASMEIFGTLIALFIGVGLVSKEMERRSLYPLLARPLSRDEFLLGKFCGLGFTLFVNTTVMTLGIYLTLAVNHRTLDPHLLKAVYPIFLSLLLVVAISLLFSTLTSSGLAAVCTFGVVLAGRYADVVRNMREVMPGTPSWLIDLLYYAVPNFMNFDLKDRVVHGDPVAGATLLWITLYAGVYASVLLLAALGAFRSKDLQ